MTAREQVLDEMIENQNHFSQLWEHGLIGVDTEAIHLELEIFLNFFDDFERRESVNEDCRDRLVTEYHGHKFFCIIGGEPHYEVE